MSNRTFYMKQINKMALPLILSSITSVFMGIVDQAFVGHISVYAYAGVGLICSCINSLVGVLGAISVAFNIRGSSLMGKSDTSSINEEYSAVIILSAFVGILICVFLNVCYQPILSIIFGLQGKTLEEAIRYLRIFSITIPLNLLIFNYNVVFKIFHNTNNIFVISLLVNIINILLDYILIFGKLGVPAMGTEGAALGTVIALFLNLVVYHYFACKYVCFSFTISNFFKRVKDIILFSLPILGQETLEDVLFVFSMNMIIARMGTIELSAYNLILQIISIIQMPMYSYSSVAISFVSEMYEENKYKEIKKIRKTFIFVMCAWFILLLAAILINAREIIAFISDDEQLINFVMKCLPVALYIQFFNYGIAIEKSILQSMGYSMFILLRSFFVNIVVVLIIMLIASELTDIFIILGIGYFFLYFILRYKSSQCLK